MTDPMNPFDATQQQMLDWMRQSQEAFMNAVNAWTEMLGQMTPGQQGMGMPGMGLREVVDQSFDSAERVLEAQRAWAHDVLRSTQSAADAAQGMVRQGVSQTAAQTQQATRATEQAVTDTTQAARRRPPS